MKQSIFITGISGCGKSTVCKALQKEGCESYDIERVDGLFGMYRKDTGEQYLDYDNSDMGKVKNAEWRCNYEKLKEFINSQKNDTAYYCGMGSHIYDIASLFDKTLMLESSSFNLDNRLKNREGTNDYANTKEGREHVVKSKEEFEASMKKHGFIPVDANGSPREVAKIIIESFSEA